MTWHIIGSNGYIASNLIEKIPFGDDVFCYSRHAYNGQIQLDLSCLDENCLTNIKKNDFVIVLAAMSSPDYCQKYQADAQLINVDGTKKLIRHCLNREAKVLFFSSDAVIGPTKTPSDELSIVHPVGNYGIMKRDVELEFLSSLNFKVFRLSYVFSKKDKFMRYLTSCLDANTEAEVYKALYRNVVYLQDVIDAIIKLSSSFDSWNTSIFHLSGPQLLCRVDIAKVFQEIVSPHFMFKSIVPGGEFFEARPDCIETTSLFLEELLGRSPISLQDAMRNEFC